MNDIDKLLILTADEINFSRLTPKILEKLALSEDLFIATLALGELLNRDNSAAATIAQTILAESLGDHFLQASALETLFRTAPKQALTYMTAHVADCDLYFLNTMMELSIEEVPFFKSQANLELITVVLDRLLTLDNNVTQVDPKVRAKFKKTYA